MGNEAMIRDNIAKNVRILMVKQHLSQLHIVNLFDMSQGYVSRKLAGQTDFTEEEMIKLTKYLGVSEEVLWEDPDGAPIPEKKTVAIPPPAPEKPIPPSIKEPLIAVKNGFEQLKAIIDVDENLKDLLMKTFRAKLAGKIDDLAYYLRNNLLIKASRLFVGDRNDLEEGKAQFVSHYLREYERWKDSFCDDIDDVLEVALLSNEQSAVIDAFVPASKTRLSKFINYMIKDKTGEDKLVDIDSLYESVGVALAQFQRIKGLLDGYTGK